MTDAEGRSPNNGMVDAAPELTLDDGPGSGRAVACASREGGVAGGGISVRRAAPLDAPSLAALWAEMQRHYGQPVTEAAAAASAAFACGTGPATGFDPRTLVAVTECGEVAGALVLNVTFPASELARSLYVRDLYVARVARRRGVARGLLRAAAALAVAEGFSTLDWTADAGNAGACRLYEREGALRMARAYFRLSGGDLLRAAGS